MAKRPHVNNYNAQKLGKAIRQLTPEQRADYLWWTHLGPEWDLWTIDQLKQLLKYI